MSERISLPTLTHNKGSSIPIMAVSAIGFCEIFIHPLCATGEFGSLLQNSPVAHRGCIKIQNPIALTAIIGMQTSLLVCEGG